MKKQSLFVTSVMAAAMFGLSVFAWMKAPDLFSDSERRELEQMPKFSLESVMDGTFMTDFESYTLDQFPLRDTFRRLKAHFAFDVLGQKDNNDIYVADGHASKMEYPLNEPMLDHAAGRFSYIYETYLQNAENVYFAIVPDKNYFLAEKEGYLSLDYEELIRKMREKTEYMTYLDLTGLVELDDYYTTDTHWKQENILDVAGFLLEAMGSDANADGQEIGSDYQLNTLDHPFYGVYYGQSALSLEPDAIQYLTSDWLSQCIVTCYDTGKPVELPMYDMEKAGGKDPYEMFLSGTRAVLTVENPNAETDRELIVFRDSFGSSLVPLLMEGYKKITVLDIRYVNSAMLGQLVEFDDQEVLFLYSTMLLNNSLALK